MHAIQMLLPLAAFRRISRLAAARFHSATRAGYRFSFLGRAASAYAASAPQFLAKAEQQILMILSRRDSRGFA